MMIDANQRIDLTVTATEFNVIMSALSKAPYEIVAPLIDNLRQQLVRAVPDAFAMPADAIVMPVPAQNGHDTAA